MFENLSERLGGVFERLTKQGALTEADVATALRELPIEHVVDPHDSNWSVLHEVRIMQLAPERAALEGALASAEVLSTRIARPR